jgi:hypothetical protein
MTFGGPALPSLRCISGNHGGVAWRRYFATYKMPVSTLRATQ